MNDELVLVVLEFDGGIMDQLEDQLDDELDDVGNDGKIVVADDENLAIEMQLAVAVDAMISLR